MAERKLTAKMIRFVDEYLIDLNATQAAIRAGYSPKTARTIGTENMAKPSIKALIDERMAEKEKQLIASQDEVLRYLTSVLRGQSSSEIVMIEGLGEGVTEAKKIQKAPDEKDRLKAAELLGKRYSLFTDKIQADVAIPVVISGEENLED